MKRKDIVEKLIFLKDHFEEVKPDQSEEFKEALDAAIGILINRRVNEPFPITSYPYNLLERLNWNNADPFEFPISDDQLNALEEVKRKCLTERELKVIDMYYKDDLTLVEIGELYSLTSERMRQILAKAIRKLKHPTRLNTIKYGQEVTEMNEQVKEARLKYMDLSAELGRLQLLTKEAEKEISEKRVSLLPLCGRNCFIDDLELSVRSYNGLRRYFAETTNKYYNEITADDIFNLFLKPEVGDCPILNIRNLGRRSISEIATKLILRGYNRKVLNEFVIDEKKEGD